MGGGSIGYTANGFVSHSHLLHLVTKHPGWVIKVSHDSPVDYLSGGIPGIPHVNLINESCQNASTKRNYIQKKNPLGSMDSSNSGQNNWNWTGIGGLV